VGTAGAAFSGGLGRSALGLVMAVFVVDCVDRFAVRGVFIAPLVDCDAGADDGGNVLVVVVVVVVVVVDAGGDDDEVVVVGVVIDEDADVDVSAFVVGSCAGSAVGGMKTDNIARSVFLRTVCGESNGDTDAIFRDSARVITCLVPDPPRFKARLSRSDSVSSLNAVGAAAWPLSCIPRQY
jgi:hypothetical protein